MKIKDENDWSDVGSELTDFSAFSKTLIPFSKKAQRQFDSHPTMMDFKNDRKVEICVSLNGTEYYVSPGEKVRISVHLHQQIYYHENESAYSVLIDQNTLVSKEILSSKGKLIPKSSLDVITISVVIILILLGFASLTNL